MSLQLTERAARRIQSQIAKRGKGLGLRVGVRKAGCSGFAYTLDYADEQRADDVVFESHGAKLLVGREHLEVLAGTTVDFRREGLNEAFRFDNPNVQGQCGCGESFTVARE
ncbi:MAG: iron-sulfur cluster assembly accessory protein [Gammaproteobacteria bacterium]|nr:iron-sulfur cluster assembly accessory protein [Gammaproteobacteria bacterium]